MKKKIYIFSVKAVALLTAISAATSLSAKSRSPVKPLLYPVDIISNNQPYIIWEDIYNTKRKNRFIITLKEKKSKPVKFLFTPQIYYKYYYAFKLPLPLRGFHYSYKIEMLLNNKPVGSKYYYYLRYPIENNFSIDNSKKNIVEELPVEYFIRYKFFEKENLLINGYNFLFYSASSTISLGAGILFFTFFDFGTIGTVIWALCFTSSAVGYSAAGYYGYHYIKKRNEMREIIKIGRKVSLKGSFGKKQINTKVELSF